MKLFNRNKLYIKIVCLLIELIPEFLVYYFKHLMTTTNIFVPNLKMNLKEFYILEQKFVLKWKCIMMK